MDSFPAETASQRHVQYPDLYMEQVAPCLPFSPVRTWPNAPPALSGDGPALRVPSGPTELNTVPLLSLASSPFPPAVR